MPQPIIFHTARAMKRFANRYFDWLDWHLLLVWLLAVPAVTPLIQPTLTRSADGLLHLYRIVALDHAIHQGALFPRWLPDLAFGYGLPLFVYYAPLSYYLSEGLNLFSLSAVTALNASFALALIVSGSGAYLFVKDLFGPKAGVLASVAYVYAPYHLYNILWRGSLPIVWAGALFPLAFWAFGRLVRGGHPLYLPLSAIFCGAALLAHNISSLTFLPLLLLYLGAEWLARLNYRTLIQSGLALMLGLGLAAFFLGPALLEREFVQVERVITPPDFDYHFNFVTLTELLALPPPANTGLLNPDPPFTMGLVQVGLAVIGLVGFFLRGKRHSARQTHGRGVRSLSSQPLTVLFALAALVGGVFMMLPLSVSIWDRLPLIAFIQQPHRLLSQAAFLLAILAGLAAIVQPDRVSFGLSVTGIILIFLTAVPLLYPRYYTPLPAPPTLSGMMAYERASGAIGTTSFGEYLPVWVRQIPRESPLEPMYRSNAPIERIDPDYLPPEARIESARYSFNQADLVIDSPEPFQAIFHTFYFPGWAAQMDGQSVSIAPVSERGLIGLAVPAGVRRLHLRFQETPIRRAANGVSVLSLLIVIAITVYFTRRTNKSLHRLQRPGNLNSSFKTSHLVTLVGLAAILFGSKALYLDRFDNPLKRIFDGAAVAEATVSKPLNFGHRVNLLGYDLERRSVGPGQTFDLTVYWQARQPLATNYSALAQLIDGQGHLYAGQDNLHPGHWPTIRWEPWGFVQDPHAIPVPPGTPPGDYFLITGLYEPDTGIRLPVVNGEAAWPDAAAIPVTVTKADRPPDVAELGIEWPVSAETWNASLIEPDLAIRLLGATPERDTIRRNDFLRVALFWEAETTPTTDYRISLRLVADNGPGINKEAVQPSFGRYPTPRWHAGERVRDTHALWISADFPVESYHLQVQLVDPEEKALSDWIDLGRLRVKG